MCVYVCVVCVCVSKTIILKSEKTRFYSEQTIDFKKLFNNEPLVAFDFDTNEPFSKIFDISPDSQV